MIKGSIVALVTPFSEDGSINYPKFKELIEYHIAVKTGGIVILGTTGEASTIELEEQISLVKYAAEVVSKRTVLIVGCGSNCTKTAVKKAVIFSKLNIDYLLAITPYYNKTNTAGLIAHFEAIASASDVPIILYNVPSRTGMSIPLIAYETLAANPKIWGIKEASGDLAYAYEVSKYVSSTFHLLAGNDDQIVEFYRLNACGIVSVLANISPVLVEQICQMALEKNYEQAEILQKKALPLIRSLFIETNPIPIKEAMNYLGFNVGGYRLPLYPMSLENKQKLLATIDADKELIY